MRYLLFFCFACVLSFPAAGQSNALGKQVYGGSYQAPVIYKTYKVFDEGYKAPARSSYDNSKPIYTGAPPKYGSEKSNSSASGPDASYEPLMPGSPFQDVSGKYGYKNAKGKILVAATYDELERLHGNTNFDGFVRVKEKGKYGVLWAYDTEQTIPAI